VIADYVGDAAPLYVQGMVKTSDGAYDVDRDFPCEASGVDTCRRVGAGAMYAAAIRLHLDKVDGNMVEDSSTSCDSSGSKSMIRPDGGIPDELRRFYDCDTVDIPVGADNDAVNYSQFAIEAMTCLAELAWRRGDPSIYTHIDPATGRGALFRAVGFLFDNDVRFKNGSKLEMINRFFTYQLAVERDPGRREEYNKLLGHDLPGRIKRDDEWPVGASFVSFGTLTHGFSTGEVLQPPPSVPPRPVVP
jgi:hypothetical protein